MTDWIFSQRWRDYGQALTQGDLHWRPRRAAQKTCGRGLKFRATALTAEKIGFGSIFESMAGGQRINSHSANWIYVLFIRGLHISIHAIR